jgi:hypothetical protein
MGVTGRWVIMDWVQKNPKGKTFETEYQMMNVKKL